MIPATSKDIDKLIQEIQMHASEFLANKAVNTWWSLFTESGNKLATPTLFFPSEEIRFCWNNNDHRLTVIIWLNSVRHVVIRGTDFWLLDETVEDDNLVPFGFTSLFHKIIGTSKKIVNQVVIE